MLVGRNRGTAAVLALLLGAAMAATAAPRPAAAAPGPAKPRPTAVQIAGHGLGAPLTVQKGDRPDLFRLLLGEVDWLATAVPQTTAPRRARLGPKYTLTVLANGRAQQVYDLYPLAKGGPRAHRPAAQPGGRRTAGWFFGRLTMSESLRKGGAPLPIKTDVAGGTGGGIGEDVTEPRPDPADEVTGVLSELRRLMLLNGAVVTVILSLLAAFAFLVRRRV